MKKITNQPYGSHAGRMNYGGGQSSEGSLCSH